MLVNVKLRLQVLHSISSCEYLLCLFIIYLYGYNGQRNEVLRNTIFGSYLTEFVLKCHDNLNNIKTV